MIVDAHCHAGTGDGFRGPWDTEAALDRYLPRARAAGIDHTLVFPVFNGDYAAAADRLARIVARAPDRLTGFVATHPQRDADVLDRLIGRAAQVHGFRGIKVHGAEAHPSRRLCELAARYRMPVLYDVYRQPARIEMLASQFPQVTFIVPHLGGFADDWAVFLTVIDQLERLPGVYADTSGVRYFDALVEAARRAPEKLIFGSDGPLLHPGVELAKVRALGLPGPWERQVTGGTVARLLGWEDDREQPLPARRPRVRVRGRVPQP